MAILRRTERAMVRAMCGAKLMDKRNSEVLMEMLGLKNTLDGMARASGVRWFGHVLRRDENDILRKALDLKVEGQRKRGRPKVLWEKQVEKEMRRVGLRREDAVNRAI